MAMAGTMRERRFKTRSVEGTLELGERIAEMLMPAPLGGDPARRGGRGEDDAGEGDCRGAGRGGGGRGDESDVHHRA